MVLHLVDSHIWLRQVELSLRDALIKSKFAITYSFLLKLRGHMFKCSSSVKRRR